jgi:tRNA(Arg) A34 adenosine deaminase TadA
MVAVDRYLEERTAGIRRFYYAFVQTRMRVDVACFVSESIAKKQRHMPFVTTGIISAVDTLVGPTPF